MKIAIFGGSFDPPHIEHVRLAQSAVKSLKLDKLFIMPAHTPPHKRDKALSSDDDRLTMCRLAFKKCPKTEVSDYEISRGGTSYTYLTCHRFKEAYPDAELFFLVGTDMLRDFPSWREPEEILETAELAVCARNEEAGWAEREQAAFYARFKKKFALVDYNGREISSTRIRVYAAAGENAAAFVGETVAAYIAERHLYEIPFVREALALEKPSRRAHSIRVAVLAAERAAGLHIEEKRAVTAALFHDCAKSLSPDSPYLKGFEPPKEVPPSVLHQYAGAYVAQHAFGVSDTEVLDAIRYHTSGRKNMSALEKLIFLADMLESGRDFEGVDALRRLFWKEKDNVDECMQEALKSTIKFLEESGKEIYPLTREAYTFIKNDKKE